MDNPFFNDPDSAAKLTKQLEQWEGTPILRCSPGGEARKRMGGNCVTIVTAIMKAVGACPPGIRLPDHNAAAGYAIGIHGPITIESFMEETFDSKGLTQAVFPKLENLILGDVIAFNAVGGDPRHLGIYFGKGCFYHAAGNGLGSTFRRSYFGDNRYTNNLSRVWRFLRNG